MIVPENIRKPVAFIAARNTDGEFIFAGSAFWFGKSRKDGSAIADPVYLVTARHVIDALANRGALKIYVRVNLKNGDASWIETEATDWLFHPSDPTVDVAIYRMGIPPECDHLVIPYDLAVTDDVRKQHGIDLGDEVFVTGLFRHHHGTKTNIPIVRVGNLAAMSEERVQTKAFGLMRALLIECRSIGGLSGSPVFVNLGITRLIGGQFKQVSGGQPIFFLLGVIHGHYDIDAAKIDGNHEDASDLIGGGKINTGIAIVTPIHCVFEVIESHSDRS
jgi:hypothetical protein